MSSADTETPEAPSDAGAEAAAPSDELRAGVLAAIESEFGDAVAGSHIHPGRGVWARVTPAVWRAAGDFARRHLGCEYFCFLSAIDWLPSPYGRYEVSVLDTPMPAADPGAPLETGVAGGDTRFQVFARVASITRHLDLILKVDVPDDTMTVDSWVPNFAGADWHERETWEMFGINFAGHDDLRHIYLPGDFEGHPLRKDYPLLARVVKPWPGIVDVEPMPGEASEEGADGEPAEEGSE